MKLDESHKVLIDVTPYPIESMRVENRIVTKTWTFPFNDRTRDQEHVCSDTQGRK